MQTFLCYKTHAKTMAALDAARLGKQRPEAIQILQYLVDDGPMVGNSHIYVMWDGWEAHLAYYGMLVAHEYSVVRRNNDTTMAKFKDYIDRLGVPDYVKPPPWMNNLWLLRSHRSNLILKMEHHYSPIFGDTPVTMPYLWAVNDHKEDDGYWLKVSKADMARLKTGERVLPSALDVEDWTTGRIVILE